MTHLGSRRERMLARSIGSDLSSAETRSASLEPIGGVLTLPVQPGRLNPPRTSVR